MDRIYLDLTRQIERMHRRYLDVLRLNLVRLGVQDLNGVQALLLVNIGPERITIKDLIDRGYYQGSNVSYNIKKLTELGYLTQARADHDKRSVSVLLTEKALDIVEKVKVLDSDVVEAAQKSGLTPPVLSETSEALAKIERIWADTLLFGPKT